MDKIMKKSKQKNQDKIINYDRKSDVFYIGIKRGVEEECVEIAPGVNMEINENGEVVGIEILNASKIFKLISQTPALKQKPISRQREFSIK